MPLELVGVERSRELVRDVGASNFDDFRLNAELKLLFRISELALRRGDFGLTAFFLAISSGWTAASVGM